MFGTMIAVLALCATAVFGASLSHLTATPALYGDDYQVSLGNPGSQDWAYLRPSWAAVERDQGITGIMLGMRDEISIDGLSVFSIAGKAVRGPLLMSAVSGRDCLQVTEPSRSRGHHETGPGGRTRGIGRPRDSAATKRWQTHGVAFHVVGTTSFPGQFGLGGLGTGAAFTLAGFENVLFAPQGQRRGSACTRSKGTRTSPCWPPPLPTLRGGPPSPRAIDTNPGNSQRPIAPTSPLMISEKP